MKWSLLLSLTLMASLSTPQDAPLPVVPLALAQGQGCILDISAEVDPGPEEISPLRQTLIQGSGPQGPRQMRVCGPLL